MISRRKFLIGASAVALLTKPAFAASGIIAGAIRWDAWYNEGSPGFYAQFALNPTAYQYRAPWFCTPHPSENVIDCAGDRQLIMDLEIGYAAAAGLKFWAFDQYSPSDSDKNMITAWNFYQKSALNSQINWCWIAVSDSLFGSDGNFSTQVAQYVSWFQQPNYQKVLTNRPLLFLFFSSFGSFSSASTFATMLASLRTATTNAGLGSPYIVVMNGFPTVASIAADCMSGYIGPIPAGAGTAYSGLATSVEAYWTTVVNAGNSLIPICQMGWDKRARQQNPPPWELTPGTNWVVPGTISERTTHIQNGVNYINSNPSTCPSKALIIYSWTECDEGGGALIPTVGDPPPGPPPALNGILSAIKPVLTI